MPKGRNVASVATGYLLFVTAGSGLSLLVQAADVSSTPDLAEVVVTGSRTALSANQSTLPVQVLDAVDLERTGVDAVGTILQTLPMNTGAPMNSNINNSGDGSTRVDLRGVGPSRTLLLLNGRRLMNGGLGGDESVDLTSLPLAWIDHVDVVTSGASAIYGADAVAGVINIITKHDVQGLEVAGSYESAERGDGQVARFNANGGFVRDGTSLQVGGEFVKQDGLTLDKRGYFRSTTGVLRRRWQHDVCRLCNDPEWEIRDSDRRQCARISAGQLYPCAGIERPNGSGLPSLYPGRCLQLRALQLFADTARARFDLATGRAAPDRTD